MIISSKEFKKLIETQLKIYFKEKLKQARAANKASVEIVEEISSLTLNGGKRLRAYLVYLGFGLIKRKQPNSKEMSEILILGSALEVFQSFCLIHDDIIDKADTRRGMPTIQVNLYRRFKKKFNEKKSKHLALTGAILAGDLCFSYCNDLLSTLSKKSFESVKKVFFQMQMEVCYGQLDDTLGVGIEDLNLLKSDEILNMLDLKSGRYSVEKPLIFGGKLADISDTQYRKLSQYGKLAGLVFQLTDDYLSFFGSKSKIGKSGLLDLVEGKRTYLILTLLETLDNSDKNRIIEVLNSASVGIEDYKEIKKLLIETGAIEKYNLLHTEIFLKATEVLNFFLDKNPYKEAIESLNYYLKNRKA